MKISLAILFSFLLLSGIARAGDEQQINSLLEKGGLVHLPVGTYTLTDSIVLQSNTILEGEPGTVIKLIDNAGWKTWTPLVIGTSVHNITIRNIEFDCNGDNQANAPTWSGHNGNQHSNRGMGNYNIIHVIDCDSITVCNCLMHDGLCDGFRVKTSTNIKFYNNTAYRLGHDCFFGIDSQNIECYNNRLTTRTDDALRIWNSAHVRFYNNVIDSQLDSVGGNPGIQIEDSKGTITDVEICNNIITKTWGAGIWLISYDQGVNNNQGILIHHNLFWQVGQSYNIQYTSGIVNDGCKGTKIYNNCFDGTRNNAFRNQIRGQETQIKDNIFTDTLSHVAISQTGTGFSIADLVDAGLSINNNCFYNNQNGNLYKCTSLEDDTQDPKTHHTSSGWIWTGSTWTCVLVSPMDLGTIAPTQTRGTVDRDTHEFNSIFDVLQMQFTNSSHVEQGFIAANETWEKKGAYTEAWLDVPVYNDTIRIGNEIYVQGSPENYADFLYGTSSSAEYPDGQEIYKSLTVEPENKLKVDLTVKTKYKVPERKHIKVLGFTLNQTVYKKKSETVKFSKTFDTPKQFPTLTDSDFNVSVTYYNNSYAPHTLVYIDSPYQNLISEVHYSFNNSSAVDYCLIGQVNQKENGAKITAFQNTSTWKFSDDQMSYSYGGLYIKDKFDLSKFKVTVKTPYSEFEVKNFNYTEEGDPTNQINRGTVRVGLCIAFLIPLIYAIGKELSFILRRLS